MTDVFDYYAGTSPLLISVPHDGRLIPDAIAQRMTTTGRAIADTDWDVARLYDFAADLGAHVQVARYSRYVIDLNRSADDAVLYPGQAVTGLCPQQSFAGELLYLDTGVTDTEKAARVERFWRPYHDHLAATLETIRQQFGYALLWDAHSIPSAVPRLFEGRLPQLNLGSNDGASCAAHLAARVCAEVQQSSYSYVFNGRFKGGYITRHYGDPARNVHALQMEIAQDAYMDEASQQYDEKKASRLRASLQDQLNGFQDAAAS